MAVRLLLLKLLCKWLLLLLLLSLLLLRYTSEVLLVAL